MPYIASTLSAPTTYTVYGDNKHGPKAVLKQVHIKGGANVANQKNVMTMGLLTPQGLVTQVSDEELNLLKNHKLFQLHLKNGHVKIMDTNQKPEKAVKDMKDKDSSAPFTPADYKEGGRAGKSVDAPKVGKLD